MHKHVESYAVKFAYRYLCLYACKICTVVNAGVLVPQRIVGKIICFLFLLPQFYSCLNRNKRREKKQPKISFSV